MFGYLKIIRPINSAVSGLTAVIACIIAGVNSPPSALLMFFIVALICGAGNVTNDFFDYKIDKINRPERPIPSGKVSRRNALIFALILFSAGLVLSVLLQNIFCFAIALVNTVLLVFYAAKLKGVALAGNILVAYLSGSIFLFGGALSGEFFITLPLFAVTFFGTLAREILKDAEDIEGDSVCGAKTMPMIAEIKQTEILAVIFVCAGVFFSLLPYFMWGIAYLVLIIIVDAFLIFVTLRSVKFKTADELKKSKTTTLLKAGMFSALAVFFIMAIISSQI